MKIVVRAFVLVLAITGVSASTQNSSASAQTNITPAKVSALPIPTCPPKDPNACGMDAR